MGSWQIDFYRRPLENAAGKPLWELVVCDERGGEVTTFFCEQAEANAQWLTEQLKTLAGEKLPERIQAFRPQSVHLLETACQTLGIALEPTRRTSLLKQVLQERAIAYRTLAGYTGQPYEPVQLEQLPPVPLPENLWGDQWRFAAIAAGDLRPAFGDRPIPLRSLPEDLLPLNLGLASTAAIPGVIIDGGRAALRLARWLDSSRPVALHFIAGEPDGLILEAGLIDRWVLTTFDDPEVRAAAETFQRRQQAARGIHFLLVQPDNSGMTYSGIWLLQRDPTAPPPSGPE